MYIKSELYKKDILNIVSVNLPWDKLRNRSLLLTGASGLIGTMLVDALMTKNKLNHLNCRIYAFGRNESKAKKRFYDYWDSHYFHFLPMDVNKPIQLEQEIDYIIHAASNTHPKLYASDPVGSLMKNL